MSYFQFIIIFLTILLNSSANILIKIGMRGENIQNFTNSNIFTKIMTNIYVISGGMCFAAGLVLYSILLANLNMSLIYPIISGGAFFIVFLASLYLFNEPFLINRLCGVLFIFSGICLVSYK